MIQASDLRIGNYLKAIRSRYNEQYILVESIDSIEGINISFRPYKFEDLKPIPLTEEILIRCGFTDLNSIPTEGGEIFIHLNKKEVGICGQDSVTSGMIYYAKCEYLHQLQNIHHSLTGQELQFR